MTDLKGRTALVTGAARGIGAAIARRLGAAGAHVAVNYAGSAEAAEAVAADIRAGGGQAFAVAADVSTPDGVAALFAACDAAFGGAPNLDILVNNAGIGGDGADGSLRGIEEALFDRLFAVNAKAPHFVTQAALPRLRDGGRIVNIGSIAGRVAQPWGAAYAMTKRALQSLTISTAQMVAKRGITCNLVAPGPVATDLLRHLRSKPGFDEGAIAATPMGRLGEPDDIAGAVMMLVGDDARWVTGQLIEATGGMSL